MKPTRALRVPLLALAALGASTFGASACGGTTPTVPTGPRPDSAPSGVRVAYPPPPARVEVLPLRRRPDCLWRDGYWETRSGDWEWIRGAWLEEPKDCYYVPPTTTFESTPAGMALIHRTGAWFDKKTKEKPCEPPPACAETSEAP